MHIYCYYSVILLVMCYYSICSFIRLKINYIKHVMSNVYLTEITMLYTLRYSLKKC